MIELVGGKDSGRSVTGAGLARARWELRAGCRIKDKELVITSSDHV